MKACFSENVEHFGQIHTNLEEDIMVLRNIDIKVAFACLMMLFFMFFNSIIAKANEPLIYVQGKIDKGYINYNEVYSKYGEIWIGYAPSITRFAINKIELFVIEKAFIFIGMVIPIFYWGV